MGSAAQGRDIAVCELIAKLYRVPLTPRVRLEDHHPRLKPRRLSTKVEALQLSTG